MSVGSNKSKDDKNKYTIKRIKKNGNIIKKKSFIVDVSGDIAFSASMSQAILNLNSLKSYLFNVDLDKKFIEQIDYAENVLEKNYISWVRSENKKELTNEEFKNRIDEFEKLIINREDEDEFQHFFQKNYFFLDARALSFVTKPTFGGEFKPDLVLFLPNNLYKIVELENPKKEIFLSNASRTTQEFGQAQQQIRDYLTWAFDNQAYLREHGFPGLNRDNTSGLLVYGTTQEFNDVKRRKFLSIKGETKGIYEVVTFDELLINIKTQLDNIERLLK